MEMKLIDLEKWNKLPYNLAKGLFKCFKKDYGYRMICKDGDTELDFETEEGMFEFTGFMTVMIENVLKELIE